jgi:hypothetical protein
MTTPEIPAAAPALAGSPAAGLTRRSAQRGRAVQGSPTGPSAASRVPSMSLRSEV